MLVRYPSNGSVQYIWHVLSQVRLNGRLDRPRQSFLALICVLGDELFQCRYKRGVELNIRQAMSAPKRALVSIVGVRWW